MITHWRSFICRTNHRAERKSLERNAFRKVSWHIEVVTAEQCDVISQQLERNNSGKRLQVFGNIRYQNQFVC